MSRSFKKMPMFAIGNGDSKYWRKVSNHKTRYNDDDIANGGAYRKNCLTYAICDFKIYDATASGKDLRK